MPASSAVSVGSKSRATRASIATPAVEGKIAASPSRARPSSTAPASASGGSSGRRNRWRRGSATTTTTSPRAASAKARTAAGRGEPAAIATARPASPATILTGATTSARRVSDWRCCGAAPSTSAVTTIGAVRLWACGSRSSTAPPEAATTHAPRVSRASCRPRASRRRSRRAAAASSMSSPTARSSSRRSCSAASRRTARCWGCCARQRRRKPSPSGSSGSSVNSALPVR